MLRRVQQPIIAATSSSVTAPMYAAATSTGLLLLSSSPSLQQATRGFQFYSPKADIPLGRFSFDSEYTNFRHKTGRAPDQNISNYRKMYARIDELARRQERFIQNQGYFFLPGLDFATYKGCQPLFTAEQLRIHFGRHHRAYVNKLNELIEGSPLKGQPLDELIRSTAGDDRYTAIFNNAAQHYNHMFFWKSITPWGVNFPPDLKLALEQQYGGSLEQFEKQITDRAMGLFGSGWLWVCYDTTTLSFDIVTTQNAENVLTMPGKVPLVVMDLWEHTWYVDYENNKAGYVANWLKCCDWHWAERHWKRAQGKEYNEMVWN